MNSERRGETATGKVGGSKKRRTVCGGCG